MANQAEGKVESGEVLMSETEIKATNVNEETTLTKNFISTEVENSSSKKVEGENATDSMKFDKTIQDANSEIDKLKKVTLELINQVEQQGENKAEYTDAQGENREIIKAKTKEQISGLKSRNIEGQEKQKQTSEKLKEVMSSKGYTSKISGLDELITRSEISFGENLVPNKEVGLSNLNKIMVNMDSKENTPYVERLKRQLSEIIREVSASDNSTLYQYVQRMVRSTHDFKDMISDEDFSNLFPMAAGSDHYNSKLIQEKNKIQNDIDTDREIIELNKQYFDASKLIEENSSYKIEALQKELNDTPKDKPEDKAFL